MLVHVTLGEVAHDLGDLVDLAGGDLLHVQLVAAGPVHLLLLHHRGAQDLEDLGHCLGVDDVPDAHLGRVLDGDVDDQPVRGEHGQLQVLAGDALDGPFGDGVHPGGPMTRIDDHVTDLVTHMPSRTSRENTI